MKNLLAAVLSLYALDAGAQSLLPLRGANLAACLLLSCHHAPPPVSNADRWPGQDPSYTRHDMILVGDSIAWHWHRRDALNHAIGGQKMDEVARFFPVDVLVYHPRAVLVEGGINDFVAGRSVDDVVQDRIKVLRMAQAYGVKVYMATVTPIAPGFQGCHPEFVKALDKIGPFNAIMARLCADQKRCTLVDLNAALDGKFTPDLYEDCVHPNPAGNARFDHALDVAMGGY